MKIILSRKGFDDGHGGCASPIMPDGSMLSMPIPSNKSNLKYSELKYNGQSYSDIWQQIDPKQKGFSENCHLDPDIRENVRSTIISNWRPAFGQVNGSQSHLVKNGVTIGDLFLFFGWFKETEYNANGKLQYKKDAQNIQAIYGYMQIGDIISGDKIYNNFPWHPHADRENFKKPDNTLYIPSEVLQINGETLGIPGFGTLNYSQEVVLTKKGLSRTRWEILDWFYEVTISYHFPHSFKDGYFQSNNIGQEFVVSENEDATEWAKSIILG